MDQEKILALMQGNELFKDLTHEQQTFILSNSRLQDFAKGSYIIKKNDTT